MLSTATEIFVVCPMVYGSGIRQALVMIMYVHFFITYTNNDAGTVF
jgi:hypothetical protein